MEQPETPDFSQYAQMMQQTMAAAMANVDAVNAEAQKAREAALDELAAAREERQKIENNARLLAEEYAEQHRQKIREEIRQELLEDVVKALLQAGRSGEEIQTWLSVPAELIETARMHLGFKKLGPNEARVTYYQSGRGGVITLQRDTKTVNFDWEFGGGDALALIFLPGEEFWESSTGIPLADRLPLLDFLATRVMADQGGSGYRLSGNVLEILR